MEYELSPEAAAAFSSKMEEVEAGLARQYGEVELSVAKALLHDLIAATSMCAKSENMNPGRIIRCIQKLINEISDHSDTYRSSMNN